MAPEEGGAAGVGRSQRFGELEKAGCDGTGLQSQHLRERFKAWPGLKSEDLFVCVCFCFSR